LSSCKQGTRQMIRMEKSFLLLIKVCPP
jgi:hypothetical protein